MLETPIKH